MGRGRIRIQLRRQLSESIPPRRSRCTLRIGQRLTHRGNPCPAQSVRPFELVDVRTRQSKARRPNELRLSLSVLIVEVHRLRRVDFVLRQILAPRQLENVETARDLGAYDRTVVPICRPAT